MGPRSHNRGYRVQPSLLSVDPPRRLDAFQRKRLTIRPAIVNSTQVVTQCVSERVIGRSIMDHFLLQAYERLQEERVCSADEIVCDPKLRTRFLELSHG